MAVSERTPCEPGTCWAESLGEACDHWKAEVERLNEAIASHVKQKADLYAEVERLREENRLLKIDLEDAQAEVENLGEAVQALTDEPAAMHRDEPCSNCDGRGFYTGWPHTTCPTCDGTGTTPQNDAR